MLLFATQDVELAKYWSDALSTEFSLYEPFVKEHKTLEVVLKKSSIDVLLLDQRILPIEGIHYLSFLLGLQKNVKIILLVEAYHAQEELSAVIFGARAYCLKTISTELLKKNHQKN